MGAAHPPAARIRTARRIAMPLPPARLALLAFAILLLAILAKPSAADDGVPLPGHVLPVLSRADTAAIRAKSVAADLEPVTLTVVLRRDRQGEFEAFLADLQDPASPSFRRFHSPVEVSDRYGPSLESYGLLKAYFESQGFVSSEGSANRLTLTFRGTRAMAESALSVPIVDYRIGEKTIRANAADPRLPADLAWRVQALVGLSDLARPRSNVVALKKGVLRRHLRVVRCNQRRCAGSCPADK